MPKSKDLCIREVSNFSTIQLKDRFDSPKFNPEDLYETLYTKSPKIVALLKKIRALDRRDFWLTNKNYKHFIFTDLKKGSAKMIASAFIAAGYNPVFSKEKTSMTNKINTDTKGDNFALLSSTALYKIPFNPKYIKETLGLFNKRPDNVYGDNIRFIILDSGFKEGIDLFDVKYVHLFEEPDTEADATQSIGRALRYCGQSGLPYGKWNVNVFIYKSVYKGKQIVNKSENNSVIDALNKTIKENSIDYLLNKNTCIKKWSFF
jgi:hypothetical protein